MEKIENEKIYRIILGILTTFSISIITLFCFFCIGLSRVDAQSYYFEAPRNHRLCEGPFNNTIACHNENSTIVNSASPGLQKGNYIIATYRADLNINGVSGTTFEAGNYSVEFAGYFTTIQNTDIDTKVIKAKLLYYPNSSNEYAVATCDNSESFRVTKTKTDEDYNFYYYSYTCETLQITTGKTFLGYQVYIDTPALVNYIDYSYITKNLTLIGEGDASNNDVISNATQNAQDIINNANQNTQEVIGAIEGEGLEDTTPIDPNKKEELEEVEQDLLKEDVITSLNDIDISIDTNSNEFIWNLITRIINTNSLIFGLVLTMLSLGVLKLVLNR